MITLSVIYIDNTVFNISGLSGAEVEKHLVVSVGEHSYIALPKGGLTPNHVLVRKLKNGITKALKNSIEMEYVDRLYSDYIIIPINKFFQQNHFFKLLRKL